MKKKSKVLTVAFAVALVLAFFIAIPNIYFYIIGQKIQTGVAGGYEWTDEMPYDQRKTVKIDAGEGDFKILVLTDVHRKNHGTFAAELGINYILDFASEIALDKLVKNTLPDLILVLGDTVLTQRNDIETRKFAEQMDGYKIPWAPVFGNHDDEGRADKARLAEIYSESEYCLFEYGPQNLHGAGNYVIEITRNELPVYALFMLDSGSSKEFEAQTAGINDAQVNWYEWNMAAFEADYGYKPENMAFFHIPTPAYAGITEFAVGGRGEDSCFENTSDDILISMLNNNGTHVFVGHDHANNFIADYNNMKIGYATKSSYNCYFKSKVTGGTLLTVPASGDVKEEVILFR